MSRQRSRKRPSSLGDPAARSDGQRLWTNPTRRGGKASKPAALCVFQGQQAAQQPGTNPSPNISRGQSMHMPAAAGPLTSTKKRQGGREQKAGEQARRVSASCREARWRTPRTSPLHEARDLHASSKNKQQGGGKGVAAQRGRKKLTARAIPSRIENGQKKKKKRAASTRQRLSVG